MTHSSTLPLYCSFYIPPFIIYSSLFSLFFSSHFLLFLSCLFYSITSDSLETCHVYWWQSDTELCHATHNNLSHLRSPCSVGVKSVDRFPRNLLRTLCQFRTPHTTHNTFRFPTIGNKNMADLQNFEVSSTLNFRSKDDVEKEIWKYATFGRLITPQNVKSQAGRREKYLHASDGN